MKKLINKEIKELEKALNNKQQWEIDNGTYLYSLNGRNDSVILKVYDSEVNEHYLQFTYTVSKEENMYKLIKSIINKLYEEEINYKQSYTRKNMIIL